MKPINRSEGQSEHGENKTWKTNSEVFVRAVAEGMQQAVSQAIHEHHRDGNPVAIWEDGRIVLLYPDGTTRPVDEEPA